MRILLVAVLLAVACGDDGVRHTPDAAPHYGAIDAAPDAPLPPAMLSISPGSMAFGDVVVGQTSAPATYTVTNTGEQPTGTLGALLDSTTDGFAMANNTCSGVELQPHGTCTFDLTFSPVAPGAAMTTVRVSATPGGEGSTAPWKMGSHNQEIYGDLLGLTADELDDLRQAGIV